MEDKKIDILPEYTNSKYYNVGKLPRRQCFLLKLLIYFLSKFTLMGKKYKIEKINMEGLKPPYLLLCNHMFFVDFKINSIATFPHSENNIISIDGLYKRNILIELIGCISTRKFTKDISIVKQIEHCAKKYKSIICMYPEARYSAIGTNAYLPESIGKLAKHINIPIVILKNHGNYLMAPFWNYNKVIEVPLYATLTQIISQSEIEKLAPAEINKIIDDNFKYDEYKWQKDNNIIVKGRARGIHKVLYKCPNCLIEHEMDSDDNSLWCKKCNKKWILTDLGELKAVDGKTEFSHVPSWFEWERAEVRKELLNKSYIFEDEVEVYSLRHPKKYLPLGMGKIVHDNNGFKLTGKYLGKDYVIYKAPLSMYSLHVEYDYIYFKHTDCIDLSTMNDSFYCFTNKQNVVTKLCLATEELYKINKENNIK